MTPTNPKFLLSTSTALEQYQKARALADAVSYSSKTNPFITTILEAHTDSLFSIHLQNELQHVADKSRVLFFAQAWTEEDIAELMNKRITQFIVDNEADLNTLLQLLGKDAPQQNMPKITLFLRLKLHEHTLRTERYFVFGMPAAVVNKRIQEIKANQKLSAKTRELGIHFHRKTQNLSEWNYAEEIFSVLDKETLQSIGIINMGGGLPAAYANTNVDVLPAISKKITAFRERLRSHNIKLMVEPGRFISAPAVKLQTTIIGLHGNTIIVNASVYNSNMDALIVPVKLQVENELSEKEGKPYVIKGITPCSLDLFRYRVYLKEPKIGDTLTFLNAGAYNFSTEFCDLEKIETEVGA
ncbi:MAG TPA: decarboxylase [Candidatus Nanoarchaeia archaeon]|nr:decarboxylase [Candidatus Nanoarchaeia archaeon]